MTPYIIGIWVAQIFAIEHDLVVRFGDERVVVRQCAIVGQKWRNHVDKVGPELVLERETKLGIFIFRG